MICSYYFLLDIIFYLKVSNLSDNHLKHPCRDFSTHEHNYHSWVFQVHLAGIIIKLIINQKHNETSMVNNSIHECRIIPGCSR